MTKEQLIEMLMSLSQEHLATIKKMVAQMNAHSKKVRGCCCSPDVPKSVA